MMNLEKMKQKRTTTKSRVKKSLLAATTFLCLTTPLLQTQTAYAAENVELELSIVVTVIVVIVVVVSKLKMQSWWI